MTTTKHLEVRYQATIPAVFENKVSHDPACIIMEECFNTTPLNSHKVLSDYCKFLLHRFIVTEFQKGCIDIHVIFNNPGELGRSPKYFEQKRRDKQSCPSNTHYCDDLKAETKVQPSKW